MKHPKALELANGLIDALRPGCERIKIAGSIRRGKPEVKDLEVVAVPKVLAVPTTDLFGVVVAMKQVSSLDVPLVDLYGAGEWLLDDGLRRNGAKYKRLKHQPSGICCDLFIVTEAGWGGAMVIRTGPAAFSQAVVTLARRKGKHVADGYLLHGHPKGNGCPKGASCPMIVSTTEERDFLTALGLPWIDPEKRIYAVVELFDEAGL